ncbi:hypothetical protein [Variovorax sp. JS1663]|uniref:hypothetical protein n=1 Tax=Variovorax sp. JS1663 TaxID=1851577 RepID=UPI000B344EE1|nr:hypothetical protein [Variovorax sp. JS1663]OUM00700.1 hypothetical protein A8M77_19630 [Variovorax sp. JS1663]
MSTNTKTIAPAAKKAAGKAAAKAPRAKKPAAEGAAKKRVNKPRVLSQKQLLARQERREMREAERAERNAKRLLQKELEKKERLAAREVRKKQREADKLAERLARKEAKSAKKLARKLGRPGVPAIKKDMEIDHAELLKPWSERPLTGRDVDTLCKRFDLNSTEFAAALGLQNRFAFAKLLRSSKVIPFDVEMLCRLYDESPSPAPWRRYEADEVFRAMYGPLIDLVSKPGDDEDRSYVEMQYSKRFTSALDRSSSTAYRWMEKTEGSGARLVIELLLRKLMSMPNPREALERMSTIVHRVRGGDFETRGPAPLPGVPRSRRGRASGRSAARRGAAMPLPIRPLTL